MTTPILNWRVPSDNEGNKALAVRELANDVETTVNGLQAQVANNIGITVSTEDGYSYSYITELRLPAGTLTILGDGVVKWTPSLGGIEDA